MKTEMEDPTTMVIFGASGDLTRRKLIPALFSLFLKRKIPFPLHIVGFSRSNLSDKNFRESVRVSRSDITNCTLSEERYTEQWNRFERRVFYRQGNYTEEKDYSMLEKELSALEDGGANRLYYLAIPPAFIEHVVKNLGRAGMLRNNGGWKRVVVEKPFGQDLESAQKLNQSLHQYLSENQIYRIDHYLGKETVQNVLVFRFGNTVFEPIWNRNYIDHVQITMSEIVDVGHRAGYYDSAGVLRDIFQNHMLQLLALVAMEPPASFNADAIRNEKVKLFSALRPISPDKASVETVLGQYEGYRETKGVSPDSHTETYAALRLFIDNWRWKGVPFYLRSGKALKEKRSEIIIQFREPPHVMFPIPADAKITSNLLTLCIQPNEGIRLQFEAKVPDTIADMRSVNMEFHHADSFGACSIPEAYERLLLDAFQGDAALFTRSDGIECSWRFIDSILEGCHRPGSPEIATYPRGSWGPKEADIFIQKDGRKWLNS
jgi:glucose-6-phosphate 1-dehydrogenase